MIKRTNLSSFSPITPFKQFDTTDEEYEEELPTIDYIQDYLHRILLTLQSDRCLYEQRTSSKINELEEKCQYSQNVLTEMIEENSQLQRQNQDLKLNMERMVRYVKSQEIKYQLLNNKINQLNQLVTEKQAIIRYLQEKSQNLQKNQSKNMLLSESISHNSQYFTDDISKSIKGKREMSFGSWKNNTDLKFQDYSIGAKATVRNEQMILSMGPMSFKQTKRLKTNESLDFKQNQNVANVNLGKSSQQLQQFLKKQSFGKKEQIKSFSRKQPFDCDHPGSFWKFSNNISVKNRRTNSSLLNQTNSIDN